MISLSTGREFAPTRLSNPCLICGDISGKCRQTPDHLNLCMNTSGVLPGFHYLGQTKDGLWAKYILDNGLEQTQDERNRRFQDQQQIRQQRATAEAQRHAESLPAEERDRLYRQLLDQLSLHPADRADLKRRGLTDEQIDAGGFRSVEQWQKLDIELPHTLPGINLDGRSLIAPRPGYLCPIRDVDGYIVSFQIRARNGDGQRYAWFTGKTRKRPNGPTPHTPIGELPLSVFSPERVEREAIALVEGVGAKPFILAQTLGIVTIGAAGGLFAASPETLKLTLDQLGSKTIEFYPDAGAVQNKSVLRQYRATFKLLEEWGYTVQIVWWGQEDKRVHPDIDELTDLSQIRLLSVAEFEAIAAQFNGLLHKLQQLLAQFARPLAPAQGFGPLNEKQNSPEPQKDPNAETQTDPPSPSPRRQRRVHRSIAQLIARAQKQPSQTSLRWETGRLSHARRLTRRNRNHSKPSSTTPFIHDYKEGDRLKTWQDSFALGYRYVLDISAPGTGKSYDSGRVTPEDFGVHQVIYLSDQHRNPTVETLDKHNDWSDLEARHGGLTRVATNESSRLQRSAKGEIPAVPANCSRNGVLNTLRDKNVSGADTANLICGTCVLRDACINAEGPGFGYLNQRRNTLGSPLLRAHPDSLPDPDDFSLDEVLLIWDEPSRILQVKQSITVTYTDLQQTLAALIPYPELFCAVQPLLLALLPLLDGSANLGRHGLGHLDVVGRSPDVTGVDIGAIAQVLSPQLGFLNTTADYGVDLADLPKELRKKFTEHDAQIAAQAKDQVIKQWLVPLIRTLQGGAGCIQVTKGGLTLSLPALRHRTMAGAAFGNVFLDGTLSREDLALKLGCSIEEIRVVRQAIPETKNLELIQVSDVGRVGMQRGGDQTKRTAALVSYFQDQDASTKVIDFKKFEADGAWWRDSRGVNDFLSVNTLVLIGAPCRNLNDLAAEFAIVSGSYPTDGDLGFKAFVNRSVLAEIHQAIGRLRAHRRLDEVLRVVLISNIDLDVPAVQRKAQDLTVAAACKTERIRMAIESAILSLHDSGQAITQSLVSAMTSIPRGTIARYWKLFILLLNSFNSQMNKPESGSAVDPESLSAISGVINTFVDLPLDQLLPSLDEVFYDWLQPHQWVIVWQGVDASVQMTILEGLALTLPGRSLEEAGTKR